MEGLGLILGFWVSRASGTRTAAANGLGSCAGMLPSLPRKTDSFIGRMYQYAVLKVPIQLTVHWTDSSCRTTR